MADLNLQKVDLSPIEAIAHDGITLQVIVECDRGYFLESLPSDSTSFSMTLLEGVL